MKLSSAQRLALQALDECIARSACLKRPCSDAGFVRSMGSGKRPYAGPVVSGEEAYFLRTDRGLDPLPDRVNGWDRYKQLVIAHRLRTITVQMIAEDVPKGIVSWPELYADMPLLCDSVRKASGLRPYSRSATLSA